MWVNGCYLRHRTILKYSNIWLLKGEGGRVRTLDNCFKILFACLCTSHFFLFKFCWQFNFFPLPDLFSWVFPSALVNVIAVFSCLVVLLKSLGGVKSVLAKINLYDLLGCSIFRLLPALWEMQQAEPSFLCRIVNSVAFPVHMLQVRQNGELYLCLLYPS